MCRAKLTAADVMKVRSSKMNTRKLARSLGVNSAVISAIRRGATYKWVTDDNSVAPAQQKLMPRHELLRLIEKGHEWVGPPPENVSLAIKSLRSAGKQVLRITRYEIVESDDFD